MILCVTPNPAIDRTLIVPEFHPADVSRAREVLVAAGGKGMNVARVIQRLGGDVLCAGPLGGHSGRWFAELAATEGLRGAWTPIAAETRFAIIIAAVGGRDASLINEPGPALSAGEWEAFCKCVRQAAADARAVTISGSVANGPTPGQFAQLLAEVVALNPDTWVDTSGAWLRAAAGVAGLNVKVNAAEIEAVAGQALGDARAALASAQHVRATHALRRVIITLGRRGAVLASAAGAWTAAPPAVSAVSSVGSGDAFLGALSLALAQGEAEPEALRRGVAAGAANAMSVGGGSFDLGEYQAVLARVRLEG